jgi:hypothetical protein
VQHNSTIGTNPGIAPASNITTGNYILATCSVFASGTTISVSDNASGGSNTYTDTGAGAATNSTGGTLIIQTFKAKIVNGGGTTPTVTCAFSPSSAGDIAIAEINGADATNFVDSTGNATPNPAAGATFTTGSVSTSAANTLLYAACVPNGTLQPFTPDYTQLEHTGDDMVTQVAVLNAGVAGTYVPAMIDARASTDNIACNTVAIKAASQVAQGGTIFPGNAWAQVTNTTSTTRSWTHVVAGGSNSLLVVSLHYRNSQSGFAPTVTYNSVSMTHTQLNCFNQGSGGTANCVDVFQLTAPSSGSHTVSVTYHATTDGHETSEDFSNTNQTTPITSIQNDTTANSSSSVTVTSTTGDWVSSHFSGQSGPTSLCAANSVVQDYNLKNSANGFWGGIGHAFGSSSVTMNWTTSSTSSCPGTAIGDNHTHVAFDIQHN